MPLTVGATPFAHWACLKPVLKHLGWQSVETPTSQLDPAASGPWLLLHSRPEYAVAHAMDQGQTPHGALEQWKTEAGQLLGFFKSRRSQAVMVDVEGIAQHPGEFVDWLAQHHNAFRDLSKPYLGALEPASRPKELNLLLAAQLVAQSPELGDLLTQLEASSIPLGEHPYSAPQVDLGSVMSQLSHTLEGPQKEQERLRRQLEEHQQRLTELQTARSQAEDSLQSENDLLLTQLHKVQEELETYYHKVHSSTKDRQELEAKIQELGGKAEELEREKESSAVRGADVQSETKELRRKLRQSEASEHDAKEENELLLKQLFLVQEELEKYFIELKEARGQLTEQGDKIKALKRQKDTLTDKVSELEAKISRGLRIENDKVLKQLVTVQEELAYQQSNNQSLRLELENLEQRSSEQSGALRKSEQALIKTEKENRELNAVLKTLRESVQEQQAQKQKGLSFRKLASPVLGLRRSRRLLNEQIKLVRSSGLFDADWYIRKNPDIAAKFPEAVEHFVLHGGREGRSPSPKFDSAKYLKNNPDVAEAGLNPLVHYLLHGKAERRKL